MPSPAASNDRPTSAGRLPDFVVVGAMRCGTSALRRLLARHPDCDMVQPELNFFSHRWPEGIDWYRRQFCGDKVAGEKSPVYLAKPVSLIRMRRVIPNAKIIVQLRDPCKRFLSHFVHTNKRLPPESKFARVRDFLDSPLSDDALWRGMYAAQLTTLFQLYPREQILILFNERMRHDTGETCRDVQRFLGLAVHDLKAEAPEDREFPGKVVRERLAAYYEGPNQALYDLLQDEQILQWTPP